MSSIEELQKRVLEAEGRFGLINERRSKYSERLVGLIDAVETRLREQTAAVERQSEELASQLEISRQATEENQALRTMLHSLLRAIEAGSRDVLSDTMQAMDAKVSTLISETSRPEPIFGLAPRRQTANFGQAALAPPAVEAATEVEDLADTEVEEPETPPALAEDLDAESGQVLDGPLAAEPEPEAELEPGVVPEVEAEVEQEITAEAEVEEDVAEPEAPGPIAGELSAAEVLRLLGSAQAQAREPVKTAEEPEAQKAIGPVEEPETPEFVETADASDDE